MSLHDNDNDNVMLSSLTILFLSIVVVSSTVGSQTQQGRGGVPPGCPSKCGDVAVPYPFGFRDGCHRAGFRIQCDSTGGGPPRLLVGDVMQVLDIRLSQGELRATLPIARDCYDASGAPKNTGMILRANLTRSPFTFSAARNKFTVTGCDTTAYLSDPTGFGFRTGCVSKCKSVTGIGNDTCSGIGCCETEIPEGLKYFQAEFRSFYNHTVVWSFNPCSYAFLAEDGAFRFNTSFLASDYTHRQVKLPVVLDWSVEGETCESAKRDSTSYACRSANSVCLQSNNELGYLCNCSFGYHGNPYLTDGCQDIDECRSPELYICNGICTNVPGNYSCSCPAGWHSDDPKIDDCVPDTTTVLKELPLALKLVIGLGSGFLFIMLIITWILWGKHKRKMIRLRHEHFSKNGGLFLEQSICSLKGSSSSHQQTLFKIFTLPEIEEATGKFDKGRIIGKGGNGTVYKGVLDGGGTVAIKRSTVVDKNKSKEFANEMLILSQINHVNIVKLLGCCLEDEIPMLVYEYVPNGTLSQLLHEREKRGRALRPWSLRLKIAAESAKAIAYLHSEASPNILHGDIKPSNILLDEEHTAKVADFGTSVLAPKDDAQLMTFIQGTWGYLDPEYSLTSELTAKSDVYSFGVVLAELLTGQKAVSYGGGENAKMLSRTILSHVESGKLVEILDPEIVADELTPEFQEVGDLVVRCLSMSGKERPTMMEISKKLGDLLGSKKTIAEVYGSGKKIMECSRGDPKEQSAGSCDNTGASVVENLKLESGR